MGLKKNISIAVVIISICTVIFFGFGHINKTYTSSTDLIGCEITCSPSHYTQDILTPTKRLVGMLGGITVASLSLSLFFAMRSHEHKKKIQN